MFVIALSLSIHLSSEKHFHFVRRWSSKCVDEKFHNRRDIFKSPPMDPQNSVERSYFGSILSLIGYGFTSVYGRLYRSVTSIFSRPISLFFRTNSIRDIDATLRTSESDQTGCHSGLNSSDTPAVAKVTKIASNVIDSEKKSQFNYSCKIASSQPPSSGQCNVDLWTLRWKFRANQTQKYSWQCITTKRKQIVSKDKNLCVGGSQTWLS